MRNNANMPYQMNNSNTNSNAMYMYMMQCMMMNSANRNMMMNHTLPNPNQQMNPNFALGFNQPYYMNPNNMNSYYQMSQRTTNNNNNNIHTHSKTHNNNIINNNKAINQQKNQLSQSRFQQDLDYEFDMLAKKREREDEHQKELSKEEVEDMNKWLEQRKVNYPSKGNIEKKNKEGELKEKKGMISQLELKLRKKNQLLKRIEGKPNRRVNLYPQSSNYSNHKPYQQDRRMNTNQKEKKTEPNDVEEGEVVEEGEIAIPKAEKPIKDKAPSNPRYNQIERENKHNITNKQQRNNTHSFKYKQNTLYEMMLKQEKIIADNILLQAFRYFEQEKLI